MTWQPIETAPKDDYEVLVAACQADVWIVRLASWSEGEHWEEQGFSDQDEARGWWSYRTCVSQEKVEDMFEPEWWMPSAPQPENPA